MLEKISLDFREKNIYVGSFDSDDQGKLIAINFNSKSISIDIDAIVNSSKNIAQKLTTEDIQAVCAICNLKATFYPNGNLRFRKLDSSQDELKSCYLHIIENRYLIIIAFDETQPSLYKAQLIALFEILN